MAKHKMPEVPFVEARNVGSSQRPTAITLSLSMTTSEKGAALGVAQYHHSLYAPLVSYHYTIDEVETYRCVPERTASYGNPYRAINVLICAQPHEMEAMWEDATASKVITRSAALVADLCLVYKIRPRYLDDEAYQRWRKHRWRRRGGIVLTLPGTWPDRSFLADVKSQMSIKSDNI